MLTADETDQLMNDIQREYPMLTVGERREGANGAYAVIVRNPKGQNEITITNVQGDWRGEVASIVAMHKGGAAETAP